MKFAAPYGLVADLHLHGWSSFSETLPSGVNSRLQGLLSELRRCAEETKKQGGLHVVLAGDVFHVRGSVAPSVLNPTKDALTAIHEEFGTLFIIIPGNHDLEGKNTTRIGSAVTALECEWVQVVNEPMWHEDINTVLVPWFESVDELKEQLQRLQPASDEEPGDAIIHAPIDGVIEGIPAHGLSPEYLASLDYKHVFAGHYHNHKAFPGNAVSIGALAHHTWSDVNSRAGFLIVTPAEKFTWFQSHLPQFIDLGQLAGVDPEEIPLLVDGNFIRARVEADKTIEVEEARNELLRMGARAVLVQKEPKKPADMEREGAAAVATGASLELSVSEFVQHMKSVKDSPAVLREALSVLGSVASTH